MTQLVLSRFLSASVISSVAAIVWGAMSRKVRLETGAADPQRQVPATPRPDALCRVSPLGLSVIDRTHVFFEGSRPWIRNAARDKNKNYSDEQNKPGCQFTRTTTHPTAAARETYQRGDLHNNIWPGFPPPPTPPTTSRLCEKKEVACKKELAMNDKLEQPPRREVQEKVEVRKSSKEQVDLCPVYLKHVCSSASPTKPCSSLKVTPWFTNALWNGIGPRSTPTPPHRAAELRRWAPLSSSLSPYGWIHISPSHITNSASSPESLWLHVS